MKLGVRLAAAMALVAVAVIAVLLVRGRPPSEQPTAQVAVQRPAPAAAPASEPVPGGTPDLLPLAGPERQRIRDKALAEVKALAERTGTTALLIWRDGALQLEHYGRGAKASDRLSGADLQQGIVPLLVGIALDNGSLKSADQPVGDLLVEWGQDPRGRITLRQLLAGTSGLAEDVDDPLQAAQLAPPGEHAIPSETETRLLTLVLERATGRRFATLLSEWLWLPMGGQDAQLVGTPGGPGGLSCCLSATARDWLRLGLLIEGRGRHGKDQLVPAAWIDAMLTPGELNPNLAMHVWLGWPHRPEASGFRSDEPLLLPDTVFLAGEGGQRLYIARSADLVILRLGAAQPEWDESVLPNLVARGLIDPPPEAVTPHQPKGGVAAVPPVTPPPRRPKVEAVPLEPPPASGSTGP
jgi:CubicO group peptidase (beta-lactamase class C family)